MGAVLFRTAPCIFAPARGRNLSARLEYLTGKSFQAPPELALEHISQFATHTSANIEIILIRATLVPKEITFTEKSLYL